MIKIRLTMMGRSYDATAQVPDEIELENGAQVGDALCQVSKLLGDNQELPESCLVVHNGAHLGTVASYQNPALADQDELVLIAPVAGC